MAEYVLLYRFTNKGLEGIKDSPKRLESWKKMLQQAGATLKANYILMGQYDIVEIIEAPDDETIAKLSLKLSSLGNLHVETHRAFNENQYLNMVNEVSK